MSDQLTLAYSRTTDPESSRLGAKRARVGGQRGVILSFLYRSEAFGAAAPAIDADVLHERWPTVQRSVWSTRLSAMCRAGLLSCDRDANPVVFRLTDAGRAEARRLP